MSEPDLSAPFGRAPNAAYKRASALFEQAVALQDSGNIEDAEKIYRAILKTYPDHFRTLHNLAGVVLRAGRSDEAARILRKALNREPNSADAHAMLAFALRTLDRHDDALERATRAVALNPALAEAHFSLATCLSDLGRYDEAVRAQGQAIDLAPALPRYYYQLGTMMRWRRDDPRLGALEALAGRAGSLPVSEQVYLNFALGKAYADCGDIEGAFRRQIAGGALKRQMLRYDEALAVRRLDELQQTIDADWLRRQEGLGDPSPLPVFILGMPRSGTTLVEQILASHPQVRAFGERMFFQEALAQTGALPTVPAAVARWSGAELRRLGARYLATVRRDTPASVTRTTDKVLENFRYVGLIRAALPNARIIHARRDPVDTCLSIFSILFPEYFQPYSYDLGELGRYYKAYEAMMAHWRAVLPDGALLEVQYEDVINDFERQARRIVAYCGLEWDDACLRFHETERAVRTASHAQVRQPIYRTSVGRPRPPRELLLPLIEALGVDHVVSAASGN